ncbi:hypothetical protein V1498_07120 [Peribacillus sp. SCS-26]|uniref:hypothetical protein n=1 Tax=Paraperibacillus marinus TaxID=3115295 RepID=UPI0039061F83
MRKARGQIRAFLCGKGAELIMKLLAARCEHHLIIWYSCLRLAPLHRLTVFVPALVQIFSMHGLRVENSCLFSAHIDAK